MPDAYENYMTFAHQMQKLQGTSLITPRETSYFTYDYDPRTMSTGSFSPSSMESPGSQQMDTCDSLSATEVFEMIGNPISNDEIGLFDRTEIKIIVQPVDKFRFRYKSEMMGTHGSLLGEREESSHKKEVPTVKLVNCPVKNAVIRCTLVTADEDKRFPHAHHLVRKDENVDKDDPHDIKVSDENDYTAMFCNMGIIHTAKKNIKEEIVRKRRIELLEEKKRKNYENPMITTKEDIEMKLEAEKAQKWMNLNSVSLCFQGFCYGENNVLHPLTEKIYSRPINNLKSALTGELKICRIDKHTSSCDGNEEVWLLVEKVGRKNIKVKFYELDDTENVIWEAEGKFSELDVHHQYAIVFKTPPYKNINITEPVEVFVKLERPSDGEVSNSIRFVYKPSEKNITSRKRPRPSSASTSMEITPTVTPAAQLLNNCLSQSFMLADPISNVSQEIKKLLNDNNSDNNIDLKQFLNDNQSFDAWLQISSREDTEITDSIVPDGVTSNQMIRPKDFAVETLKKILNVYKEIESKGKSESLMTNIKDLLQETINFGDTPLHVALRMEQYETAKCILTCIATDPMFKITVDLQNSTGKTPLHLAVLADQPEIVRALLKLGANPNICDEEDATSLHIAVKADANASLSELLQSSDKLSLEAHTESGWSALHLAAKAGSLFAVKTLHEAGADVNSKDMSYGRTALHIAVDSNHIHIVNYLLTKTKINVNEKNFGGNTALHSAVVKGGKYAEELIKLLKIHGADPNIRNNNVNREEEEEDHSSIPPASATSAVDDSTTATPTIKSESSDSDDEISRNGESSFDLARDDPKLMQLLNQHQKPQIPLQEELDLKEESEDEMPLMERSLLHNSRSSIKEPNIPTPTITKLTSQQQLQLQQMRQGDEKITDVHLERILGILDRTGGWEKLAQHTKNASLVRLHRKTSSPSAALFNKIRLQRPNLTVSQLKKQLIEIQAYEAATALDPK